MDERAYVERKKEGWARLSRVLDRAGRRGVRALMRDELAELGGQYRALVADLAYARTQGASDELLVYLNELAGRAHGVVFASPAPRLRGAICFLTREFPVLVRSSRRSALAAAAVFFIGLLIAVNLTTSDPEAARRMLERVGGGRGGPIATHDPAAMSSFIMTNNIKVSIQVFAGGITGGLLSVFFLFTNGLMIGLTGADWIARWGQMSLWSFVLPHGIIELTAIFISGGAGLMIGAAMIAPGNLRRAAAVKLAAQKAVRLFAGTVALLFVAGMIEGFVSPSVLPPWARLAFGGLTAISLALYLGLAGRRYAVRASRGP